MPTKCMPIAIQKELAALRRQLISAVAAARKAEHDALPHKAALWPYPLVRVDETKNTVSLAGIENI